VAHQPLPPRVAAAGFAPPAVAAPLPVMAADGARLPPPAFVGLGLLAPVGPAVPAGAAPGPNNATLGLPGACLAADASALRRLAPQVALDAVLSCSSSDV